MPSLPKRAARVRLVAVLGLVLAVFVMFRRQDARSRAAVPTVAPPEHPAPAVSQPVAVGMPARLRIPRIGVDAAVERVGLAADGSMGVPAHPLDAAWYEPGPRPGEVGTAAIAGHVNWYHGASGVFARLGDVRPGDSVTTQDDAGRETVFVVRDVRTYDAGADASDVFFSADGKPHLSLITCAGAWDKQAKQYADRLVVFAEAVTR